MNMRLLVFVVIFCAFIMSISSDAYSKTAQSGSQRNEFDKVFGRSGWLDLRAKADSRVYFFFSGHGIPSESEGKAYILPYDADPNYAALTA